MIGSIVQTWVLLESRCMNNDLGRFYFTAIAFQDKVFYGYVLSLN